MVNARERSYARFSACHTLSTVLFFLIKMFNYGLMLVAMTFNFAYIVAIVISMAAFNMVFSVVDDYVMAERVRETVFFSKRKEVENKAFGNSLP